MSNPIPSQESVRQVFIEDMEEGMSARLTRRLDEEAVRTFAALTGDVNPVHLDAAYAAETPFKRPIVHGMLTASLISAVLGTQLPGRGAIYVSQSIQFRAPVYVGDDVTAEVTVTAIDTRRRRVTFATRCLVGDKEVLRGEAVLIAPSRAQG
ncbi:MaoC family dehydratase [Thermopetrobacter sp. TC1]|uniref:MaoC family dehydratase n=1 Tax=Thermopetrobacter sp. TC1 TaxID=1495045 RepID=UPI000570FFA5|nr:MaoC family dehydratase [Thermopetrobacter sp. TC1]